jgi:hypothetical protein
MRHLLKDILVTLKLDNTSNILLFILLINSFSFSKTISVSLSPSILLNISFNSSIVILKNSLCGLTLLSESNA